MSELAKQAIEVLRPELDKGTDEYEAAVRYVESLLKRREREVHNVIITHKFAKAVWGDDWMNHYLDMSVADDPIKYLGEHI